MQAVILAGGLGTRMGPVTRDIPKPMVPIAGAPFLVHQLRLLRSYEIRDIVLLTGYLGEQISGYFKSGAEFGVRLQYSQEPVPLGTGGALALAAPLLGDSFLLLYGDSYLPIAYPEVLSRLEVGRKGSLMVVYDNRHEDTSVRNNVALDDAGSVLRYDKTGQSEDLQYVEAGVLAFRRDVLSLIPSGRPVSLENEIFPELIAKRNMLSFKSAQRFFDIGTPERLRLFEQTIA
jgi:NDP-sugar pyrophosphorylase family protein